jgi:RNA polymerase sigma-19 factor, ECF subfamily
MFDADRNIAERTLSLPNENDLLARIARGDEAAFGVIFHHYQNKIYSFTFHVTGSKGLAEELVQDVFLKVWQHRTTLPGLLRFDSWLFTIARNKVFDLLKNMARDMAFRRQLAGLLDPASNTVDDRILSRENEARLQQALDGLPPRQKQIFTLSRHQGLKHEEIAARLHISRHTVKTHLVQALRTLRNLLTLLF